ncbi:MAG: hypothetical protein ACTSWY_09325 [Promethearchaeota archaeon]
MELKADLERIRHEYLNKIVETQALKDFKESVKILGKRIGPFSKGNHYKMAYWIAKIFIKREILKLAEHDGDKLNVKAIQKIAFNQGRTHEINNIGGNLFTVIKEYMKILSSWTEKDLTHEKKFKSLYSNFQDLITIRHRKILNLCQMKQSFNVTRNLTQEEQILMKYLSDAIFQWKDFFQNPNNE